MGRPLSRSGVAVINIGGVAFPPFAELFGPDKLPYRCVIISDGDPPKRSADATDDDEDEIDPALLPVAAALAAREGDKLRVRLAQRTLEWDLAAAGNWDVLLEALAAVKPRVAQRLGAEHTTSDPQQRADALLAKVVDRKGRFAQELVAILEAGREFAVPSYLVEASCVSLCASTPPMTTVSASCMLSMVVPSLRTGGPVARTDTTVTRHLSQAGSYQVTRRPTRPPLLMSDWGAPLEPTGPRNDTRRGQFHSRSNPSSTSARIFTVPWMSEEGLEPPTRGL
jgi:hypothetical protein